MTDLAIPHPYWLETHSGIAFDIMSPTPQMVRVIDIAHHLALLNRFLGATKAFYSVAQHSVHVLQIVRKMGGGRDEQTQALFHDGHEAFAGDLPTPWKRLLREHESRLLEFYRGQVAAAVAKRIGFQLPLSARVIKADLIMLRAERDTLLCATRPQPWHHSVEELGLDAERWAPTISPWTPHYAKAAFLEACDELGVSR